MDERKENIGRGERQRRKREIKGRKWETKGKKSDEGGKGKRRDREGIEKRKGDSVL